ncbi:MAG: flavin reductase [Bdellovibrionales bacterium]|nr:flavin reductase [Bdellovibrionales bacterium]MBT7766300.1 flavin reductase [Bdellovibrionales bacterium]
MDKEKLTLALADIPSGLYIACVKDGEQIDGFLASWVSQVSFEPPLLMIAIKPERNIHQQVLDGAIFTLNVVGEHNKSIMKPFWNGYYEEDENPFETISYRVNAHGGVVMDDARSTITCKLLESHLPGDHRVVIARVLESEIITHEVSTLLHWRTSGMDY